MPAFLIERKDHAISGDAIWANDIIEAQTFLNDDELEAHQQSDVIAAMMKLEPKVGRYPDAFRQFVVTPRSMMGYDLPHRA
ncbi:MAG: hypothetical protein ACRD5Z_11800 [Bryobacteraceae bacterium]